MNQVKPSEQVVGRVATVSLSRLVTPPPPLRAMVVTGLTQAPFVMVLTDCDWLFFTVVCRGFPLPGGHSMNKCCDIKRSEVKLHLSLYWKNAHQR